MNSISNVEGNVIVITGASSGRGESTPRLPAEKGARVVLGAPCQDRVVTDIKSAGGTALGCATDVTRRSDVETLVDGAVKNFGRMDALVNNAGVMSMAPMAALKVEEWDRQIDVNIKGVLYGIAAVNSGRFLKRNEDL